MDLVTSVGHQNWSDVLGNIDQAVTEEMNEALIALITLEDVKFAVMQLGLLWAPGPDGFHGIFYQKYCDVVKNVVNYATNDFFNGRAYVQEINSYCSHP